jgi:addiction module HigA family antidote
MKSVQFHRAMHPGEVLREELWGRGMSSSQLGREIGVTPRVLDMIMARIRPVDRGIAVKLARWSGTSAEFWLNLQRQYDRVKHD